MRIHAALFNTLMLGAGGIVTSIVSGATLKTSPAMKALYFSGVAAMTYATLSSELRSYFGGKRNDIEATLRELVFTAVGKRTQNAQHVRCNLAVPGLAPWLGLRIKYWVGDYSKEELALRWNKGQGVIGRVFEDKRAIWADLRNLQGESYRQVAATNEGYGMWGITERHWNATHHLSTVMSVPVFRKETSEVIGVLTLDDINPPHRCSFAHDRSAVEQSALLMASFARLIANRYNSL